MKEDIWRVNELVVRKMEKAVTIVFFQYYYFEII